MKASNASNPQIRRHLLWDFDIEKFDYSKSERLVIERVIERGTQAEWREIIRFYGKAKIREVAQHSKQLDSKNRNFTFIYLDSAFNDL